MHSGIQLKRKSICFPTRTRFWSQPNAGVCGWLLCLWLYMVQVSLVVTTTSWISDEAPAIPTSLMHFKAMPYFGVAWITCLQKHVCGGPNEPQIPAVARIQRKGSTVWHHQIYSVGPFQRGLEQSKKMEKWKHLPMSGTKPMTLTILIHLRINWSFISIYGDVITAIAYVFLPISKILHPEICCFMFNTVVFDVGKILPTSYK